MWALGDAERAHEMARRQQSYSLDKMEKEKLLKMSEDMPKIRSSLGTMFIDTKPPLPTHDYAVCSVNCNIY